MALSPREALAPLQIPVFRRFWIASTVSNLGGMIQTVAAAWMMTALTSDAQMVALVQTCAALPMMLIALPAGALADIYERRLIMMVAQVGMLLVAAGLTALTLMHMTTPAILLVGTFLIGSGTALHAPSWQASLGDQVPREALEPAASLNSVAFNIARSVGPAVGGAIVATAGVAVAFAVNALSYLGLIAAIVSWRKPRGERVLPPESVHQAIMAGVRFVALSPGLLAVMARSSAFGFCGSAVWALTAVLAHDALSAGPGGFGILLGGFGIGAMIGAFVRVLLPIGRELLVRSCALAFGIGAIGLGLSTSLALSVGLMAVAGAAWMMTLTGLGVSVQFIAPRWVVGRAISLNSTSVFAGMAAGSSLWGFVARHWNVETAFIASGAAMVATLLLALPFPLRAEEVPDLTPTRTRPIDDLHGPVAADDGPIVVTVDYKVAPEQFEPFVAAMEDLGRMRRRNGAHRWTLHQDVDDPTHWIERFHSMTWLDHLRRQTRTTRADQKVRERVGELHEGEAVVHRLLERRISTTPLPARSLPDDPES